MTTALCYDDNSQQYVRGVKYLSFLSLLFHRIMFLQLQALGTMHMPACVICGDQFYAAHSTDRSSAPWNAWFRVGRCLNSFAFYFSFFFQLCASPIQVLTRAAELKSLLILASTGQRCPKLATIGASAPSSPSFLMGTPSN